MDANIMNLQTQFTPTSSDLGFNAAFFVGLGAGFILGLVASYYGNYFWEKHKKKQRGDKPYCTVSVSKGYICYEGQMPNTGSNRTVISQAFQKTASS